MMDLESKLKELQLELDKLFIKMIEDLSSIKGDLTDIELDFKDFIKYERNTH